MTDVFRKEGVTRWRNERASEFNWEKGTKSLLERG